MTKQIEHDWEAVRTETRLLPVTMTTEEIARSGYKLAEVTAELEEAREAKRADVTAHNRRIKAIEEQAAQISGVIVVGTEDRQVLCQVEADFKGNAVRVRRTDDDSVIEERAMEESERQRTLIDPDMPPGDQPTDGDDDGEVNGALPPEAGEPQADQGVPPKNL